MPPTSSPVPWDFLVQRIREGRVVPFLGAGASAFGYQANDPHPPTSTGLLQEIASWALQEPFSVCGHANFDLPKIASYYNQVNTRGVFNQKLRGVFDVKGFTPNCLHRVLAEIGKRWPILIVTTNYDNLIETAFDEADAPYEVVATAADKLASGAKGKIGKTQVGMVCHRISGDPSGFTPVAPKSLRFETTERSIIYKIHGSLPMGPGWGGGYLIAEEDYVRFLGLMDHLELVPAAFRRRLTAEKSGPEHRSSLLVLGYGMHDWNMRVLLDSLGIGSGRANEEKHVVIDRDPREIEWELLRSRNFIPCQQDLAVFVPELARRLGIEASPLSRDGQASRTCERPAA